MLATGQSLHSPEDVCWRESGSDSSDVSVMSDSRDSIKGAWKLEKRGLNRSTYAIETTFYALIDFWRTVIIFNPEKDYN